MSDAIPNAHRKPMSRREKAAAPPPVAPAAEALASAVRDAETSKAAKAAAPRPLAEAAPAEKPDIELEIAKAATAPVMPAPLRPVPAPSPAAPPRARFVDAVREHGPLAAALTMALGLGWVSGLATAIHATPPEVPPVPAALVMDLGVSAPLAIRAPQGETGRLAGDVRALATAVVDLRSGVEGARQDGAARLTRLEKAEGEASARLAQLAERVGAIKDGEVQLAAILERLERMEEAAATRAAAQPVSLPTVAAASVPPAAPVISVPAVTASVSEPTTTASLPEPRVPERPGVERAPQTTEKAVEKAPERAEIVAGWFLRGVHRGVALVEGRRGLVEVRAGEVIPGLGRVEAIERRGRDWVVVTARGIVATETW